MPKIIIQAMTMAGKIVENAKWEVEFPAGLQEGQTVSFNLPIKDPALIGYVGKMQSLDCVIDKEDGGYSVALTCPVRRIRHMVNTKTGTVDTLAIAVPINRLVEGVLTYLLSPSKCDPRFVQAVRGQQAASQP